jgi:SAM-dependent methyltransferase
MGFFNGFGRKALGYRWEHWVRVAQRQDWLLFLSNLPASQADALEISPGAASLWKDLGFRSYVSAEYPKFDITRQALENKFDIIIADNVFEHLKDPYTSARNVLSMLRNDGIFLIATPFLIKIHNHPGDYTRWTPAGLTTFLEECGFVADVKSWGNRKAITANFKDWVAYGWWRDMRNEPEFPVTVWAFARKKRCFLVSAEV